MKNNNLFLDYSRTCDNQPLENSINVRVEQSFTGDLFNDWPTLIDFNTKEYYSKVAIEVFNLIKRIPEIFNFDINKMQEYFKLPLAEIEKSMKGLNKNNINHIIGRGDFIVDKDNEIRCIEFNIGCSLGGWYVDFIEEMYLERSFISGFLESNNLEVVPNNFFYTLFDFIKGIKSDNLVDGQCDCNNIAFVHPYIKNANPNNLIKISDYYKKWALQNEENGVLVFCSFDELLHENGKYKYNDMIIQSIVDLQDQDAGSINRNDVNLICAPIMRILDNKLNLAVLCENQDSSIFSREEKEIIKKNIPWTRKLNNDQVDFHGESIKIIDYILKNKDRFVIKPAYGISGDQVCIGNKVSESEWKEKISTCEESKPFVVQEYIKPQVDVYHSKTSGFDYFETVFGLFVLGNLYGGGFTRILNVNSEDGIINCSKGAEQGILFVVK